MIDTRDLDPPRGGRASTRALVVMAAAVAALVAAYAAIRPRPGVDLSYFATTPTGVRHELPEEFALEGAFTAELTAWLRVPSTGLYSFGVVADAPSTLWVAGRKKIETAFGPRLSDTPIYLERGHHPVNLEYRRATASDLAPEYDIVWFKEIRVPESVPHRMLYPRSTEPWRFRAAAALRLLLPLASLVWVALLLHRVLPAAKLRIVCFAALTVVLATVAALVIVEVSLRIGGITPRKYVPADVASHYRFWQPDATMEYIGITPYLVQEYRTLVRYNSRGWRDREYPAAKSPDSYRIVVLGDSFVEALNVELDETFHKRLESMLNQSPPSPATRYEVIALGRAGTTTEQQIGFYEAEGAAFDPDLVLLCFFPGNDAMEHSRELSARFTRWSQEIYYRRVVRAKARFLDRWLWLRGSYLNHFVVDRLLPVYTRNLHLFEEDLTEAQLRAPDVEVYRVGPYDEEWSRAWLTTARNVDRLRRMVIDDGARFVVVVLHSRQAFGLTASEVAGLERDYDLSRPTREIIGICESNAIPYLDLEGPMERRRRPGERLVYDYDMHWNPAGHRLAAEAILEHISPILVSR